MFTIIGGDGKEYGPVTTEQVRGWIAAGRANQDTKAKAAGSEEWRRLGDFPEFGAAGAPPLVATATVTLVDATELADRGLRLVAALLDSFIGCLCALPGFLVLGTQFFQVILEASRGHEPDFNELDLAKLLTGFGLIALGMLVICIVQVVMISTRGQTIGKRIVNVQIVRMDGSKAGFVHGWLLRAVVPAVIGAVPWLGSIFTLVDICFIFRQDRRCIHDLIADTKVVKAVVPLQPTLR